MRGGVLKNQFTLRSNCHDLNMCKVLTCLALMSALPPEES